MKTRLLLTLAGLAIGFALPVFAQERNTVPRKGFSELGPIITFDAPSAGTGKPVNGVLQGTFPTNINGFGVAIGYFVDANIVPHGFVRYPFGQMTTIDAPGAGMVPGANQGTVAFSINIEGTIAGQYQDTNFVFHCFLRYPDGHIITFDPPGAGTGPNQGSEAVAINLEGTVAGITIDNHNVLHGFIRSALGTFTSFDAPNASMMPNAGPPVLQGTFVTLESSLNVQGEIIGWYFDAKSAAHGYLRKSNGTFIEFDPPNSANTNPGAINSEGLIVGGAYDSGGVLHGFVRSVNGAITTFDVPGAGKHAQQIRGDPCARRFVLRP